MRIDFNEIALRGKAYKRILIPNTDPADHSPWASFVLPAKGVHENQYGKGLWAKIPAEGHTTVTKPETTAKLSPEGRKAKPKDCGSEH